MSSYKRFLPFFASLLLLVACAAPSAVTGTIVPSTPTVEQANLPPTEVETIVPTETSAPTDTPTPVQPPLGAPIAHLPAGQEIKITFIHMLDGGQGWAIGGLTGDSDHIFRTADGGLTWKDATPPEPVPADPTRPKKATGFFMDAQEAWVAFFDAINSPISHPDFAYIWRTTDGGATWQSSKLTEPALYEEGYSPTNLSFVDAQHGWMIVHVDAGMNHDYYVLLTSADGGATWQTLVKPQEDSSNTQSCTKTGLVFVTSQDGWMAIDCHGVVSTPYIFKSQDGGVSWQSINLPMPPSLPDISNNGYCGPADPTLFTPTNGDLVLNCVQYDNTVSTTQSFLYETTDAGATWNTYSYPGGHLQFIDASTAFALGRDIQRSDDAGHTWKSVTSVNWDGQFSFIDAQTAWAVATDNDQIALVKTSDGALTWQEIKPKTAP